MRILLVRPGSFDEEAGRPASRHLSAGGRAAVRNVVFRVKNALHDLDVGAVLTAPSPECVQTAELAAGAFDFLGVVKVWTSLVSPTPPTTLLGPLLAAADTVVVVADEPFLSGLGAAIAGRPSFPTQVPAQLSLLEDRKPFGFWREGSTMQPLLLA